MAFKFCFQALGRGTQPIELPLIKIRSAETFKFPHFESFKRSNTNLCGFTLFVSYNSNAYR